MLVTNHLEVFNFEGAIRGMRNPKNSWKNIDSSGNFVGPKDLDLMKRLFRAGTDHRKYLRQILVSVDITAPLYWWKELDTYKVGTVANSCSTMHKITAKEFTEDDFSFDDKKAMNDFDLLKKTIVNESIETCNFLRNKFLETNDKKYWRLLIQYLPSSYNQKRTITMNYEVAYNIYFSRKNHKLTEWHTLCDTFVNELPYFKEIMEGN